jgi:hypothetical protein
MKKCENCGGNMRLTHKRGQANRKWCIKCKKLLKGKNPDNAGKLVMKTTVENPAKSKKLEPALGGQKLKFLVTIEQLE